MRPLTLIAAAATALALCGPAAGQALPEHGFMVYKDTRATASTEVREWGTGRLVLKGTSLHAKGNKHALPECQDGAFALAGPSWPSFERYVVNVASRPSYLAEAKSLQAVRKAHDAWERPFTTRCKKPKDKDVDYDDRYGGRTSRLPTLVTELENDGVNTVGWTSLAGTVCDGATACVVFEYVGDDIVEADLAMEEDLTRYGFQDFWTTDETLWFDDLGGRWPIIDVATHEFGHFAGLDHVLESPDLTMYPFVHDGAQTLGLGDMLGVMELY